MKQPCYYKNCKSNTVGREHAPPKCFFNEKKGNLITVPSCPVHNLKKSGDDEYVRNIFTLCNKPNSAGTEKRV